MANDRTLPHTLANGVGNWPDATQLNENWVKVNDAIYISATAPDTPYAGQIWIKTDEPMELAVRIYWSDSQWHNLWIGGIVS